MTVLAGSMTAAFLVGLGGGAHCALMCGGISAAIVAGNRDGVALSRGIAAQLGRIFSYVLAAALVSALSAQALAWVAGDSARMTVHALLGVAWISIGLHMLGWLPKRFAITRWGGGFWKLLQPLSRRIWPIDSWPRALLAGALWGWLPCGMSYAMLLVAAATANVGSAMLTMLAFGLGTMPALLLPALAAIRLQTWALRPRLRQFAAVLMLMFGGLTALSPMLGGGAHDHHVHAIDADASAADAASSDHQHHHH